MSGVATAVVASAVISSQASKSAASKAAGAQERSAQIAAEAAKFTPYNITTALGGAQFGDGTVDINYNPELAAYRDRLFSMATGILPEDIRAAEEEEYQRLVAGGRSALEQQTAQLGTGLFRTGRQGLNVFGAQPELRAFSSSLLDRENQLRQAARTEVANRIAQSTGLATSGFGVETALLQPLSLGAELGGRAMQGGIAGAQLLGQAGSQAAQTRLAGSLVGPSLLAQGATMFGGQALRNQQQNQLYDRLYGMNSPWGMSEAGMLSRGVNLYGAAPPPTYNWYTQTPTDYIMP